mgnify:CR=1 FL=1
MTDEVPQKTLDPENWDEMRALAHRMVDDAITYLETVGERPVWQPVPEDIAAGFNSSVPREPAGADAVYREFLETIFPYPMGTQFYGQVRSPSATSPLPVGRQNTDLPRKFHPF